MQPSYFSERNIFFYLEEGDSIRATASAANDIDVVIGYEDIS